MRRLKPFEMSHLFSGMKKGLLRNSMNGMGRGKLALKTTRCPDGCMKREAKGSSSVATVKNISNAPVLCRICGADIKAGFKYCRNSVPTISRENILEASKLGRLATHKPEAQARRAETQRRQNAALKAWNPADKPKWLDQRTYDEMIKPRLTNVIVPRIMSALSISAPYALRIRSGKCIPHPRHWLKLATLAGFQISNRT
jgi:hypothetical protein